MADVIWLNGGGQTGEQQRQKAAEERKVNAERAVRQTAKPAAKRSTRNAKNSN